MRHPWGKLDDYPQPQNALRLLDYQAIQKPSSERLQSHTRYLCRVSNYISQDK